MERSAKLKGEPHYKSIFFFFLKKKRKENTQIVRLITDQCRVVILSFPQHVINHRNCTVGEFSAVWGLNRTQYGRVGSGNDFMEVEMQMIHFGTCLMDGEE
jgi:hypothetical protein